MSLCKYAFYKEEETCYPRLYCKADNKWCVYVKRCDKVEKFIPIKDNVWEECGKYIMEKRKEIPEGAYFVQTSRPNRSGNLLIYVALENKTIRIETQFKKLEQEYIYLKETKDGYEVSLEPFKEEKKKENITIHVNEELLEEKKEEEKKEKRGKRKVKEYIPVVEYSAIEKTEEDE